MRRLMVIIFMILRLSSAFAADEAVTQEFEFHLGNLLPNGPEGVAESMGLGGLRYSVSSSRFIFYELGIMMGAANGVTWQDIHGDVRMDIPVQDFICMAYIGADAIHYTTSLPQFDDDSNPLLDENSNQIYKAIDKTTFGAHIGGGLMAQLSWPVWLRTDMKLNLSPSILYIGFGLSLRL